MQALLHPIWSIPIVAAGVALAIVAAKTLYVDKKTTASDQETIHVELKREPELAN